MDWVLLIPILWFVFALLAMYLWGKRWRSIDLGIILTCLSLGPVAFLVILLCLAGEIEWRW